MNPENLKPNEQPDLSFVDTSEIIMLLKRYNKQFSMGHTAARMVMDAWEKPGDEENPETKTTALNEQAAEQLLSFDEMKAQSALLLDTLGLEYQPMKANWFVAGNNETHIGSEMRLNLKDGKKFVDY